MAFENILLNEEERKKYQEMNIPDPGTMDTHFNTGISFSTLMPSTVTIDKERDIVLLKGAKCREEPYEEGFVLLWKGYKLYFQLLDHWSDNYTRIWSIRWKMIPEEVKQHEQEFFKDFKESLKVYGFSGYCYRQKDIERNEKLEIKFDF